MPKSKKPITPNDANNNGANDKSQASGLSASIELEQLTRQVVELTEALQRERADSTNIRRRHEEQLASLKDMLKSQVIEELLPVIDNFERALKHVPADIADNAYVKGVQGVVKQFETTLGSLGVQRIKTVGEHFDPNFHDAISIDGEGDNEQISEELQAGYQLGDTVIRHATVRVTRS